MAQFLPHLWLAASENPVIAQHSFSIVNQQDLNLPLCELERVTHRHWRLSAADGIPLRHAVARASGKSAGTIMAAMTRSC